jgi:hypothetical protein
MQTMKSNKSKKIILRICSFLLGIGFLLFFGMLFWMYSYAKEITSLAENEFHKGKIESLLAIINSSDFSLRNKNQAIEVLGTLKDKKALPKLESLVTHEPCNHSMNVCQYELEKAILKIKGEYAGTQKPFNAFLFRVTDGMNSLSYAIFSL